MQQTSASREIVVNLSAYRERRRTVKPQPKTSNDDAEKALKEISTYLLMAVRVLTSRQ